METYEYHSKNKNKNRRAVTESILLSNSTKKFIEEINDSQKIKISNDYGIDFKFYCKLIDADCFEICKDGINDNKATIKKSIDNYINYKRKKLIESPIKELDDKIKEYKNHGDIILNSRTLTIYNNYLFFESKIINDTGTHNKDDIKYILNVDDKSKLYREIKRSCKDIYIKMQTFSLFKSKMNKIIEEPTKKIEMKYSKQRITLEFILNINDYEQYIKYDFITPKDMNLFNRFYNCAKKIDLSKLDLNQTWSLHILHKWRVKGYEIKIKLESLPNVPNIDYFKNDKTSEIYNKFNDHINNMNSDKLSDSENLLFQKWKQNSSK